MNFLKEFKKPYPLNLFSPLVATIVYQREFVSIWKIALEVSSIESNQRQTILNKVEKFIHNDNANDLINSINLVCKNLTIGINKLDMHLQTVNNSKLSSLENKLQIVKDESYILQMFQNDLIKIKV